MNKKQFLNLKVSGTDTVTVSAIELQNILEKADLQKRLVSELENSNQMLLRNYNQIQIDHKQLQDAQKRDKKEFQKLRDLNVAYIKLQKAYDALADKLCLSNAISEGRKQRLHCKELTKGLHVDLKS